MTTDHAFTGSIPELYERLLVPLLFASYASDLAARVAALSPQQVLETAAGTGALTRALAAALPGESRVVATDLNQPMLERGAAALAGDARLSFRQADALALPFEAASFDAVACQFGVMFFPDKVAGYREARRVLRPGGHFVFNSWDRIEHNELAHVVSEALARLFPQDPPRFMARTPHGYYDADGIRRELAAAGFSSISIETRSHVSRAASAHEAATAYCQGTPLRGEIEARSPQGLAEATQTAAEALSARFGAGAIEARIQALVITAKA